MPEKIVLLLGHFKNQKIQNCLAPNLRQFGNQFRFYGGKPPLLLRSMRIDFKKFRKGDFKL